MLPYPLSANDDWRPAKGRGLVPSDKAMAYKARVAQVAALARIQPLHGPVRLVLTVFRPRRRQPPTPQPGRRERARHGRRGTGTRQRRSWPRRWSVAGSPLAARATSASYRSTNPRKT